jgi:hypothetical protein
VTIPKLKQSDFSARLRLLDSKSASRTLPHSSTSPELNFETVRGPLLVVQCD